MLEGECSDLESKVMGRKGHLLTDISCRLPISRVRSLRNRWLDNEIAKTSLAFVNLRLAEESANGTVNQSKTFSQGFQMQH